MFWNEWKINYTIFLFMRYGRSIFLESSGKKNRPRYCAMVWNGFFSIFSFWDRQSELWDLKKFQQKYIGMPFRKKGGLLLCLRLFIGVHRTAKSTSNIRLELIGIGCILTILRLIFKPNRTQFGFKSIGKWYIHWIRFQLINSTRIK